MKRPACLMLAMLACAANATQPVELFQPADLARIADLTEPGFAPDGKHLVYTLSTANLAHDKTQSDLWRVGYDGSDRRQLTDTPTARVAGAMVGGRKSLFFLSRPQAGP